MMVRLERLTKSFGGFTALQPIELAVERGEFVTLLGPSGCGKTTTLMLVAGFERPTAGEIYFDRTRVTELPPNRRDIGIVFQQYALFPHFNVYDNIAFPLRVRKLPNHVVKERIAGILEAVRLGRLADRFPRELSGGQQQRVALARALVYRPSILLMDEPLAALDRKLREDMQLEIKRIHQAFSTTTIYVTHDQQEALTMSDRIVVMNQGRIEQSGKPHEVYEQPRTEFVAKFLGESNVFRGRLDRDHGEGAVLKLEGGAEIKVAEVDVPELERRGSVAVRPEKMRIVTTPSRSGNRLPGTINDIVYQGELTRVFVDAHGQLVTVTESNSARTRANSKGEQVWVQWREEDTILLRDQG